MDNYSATEAATRTQRLDELPVTRKHARLLGVSGIGWALDAMDVGLISFIMAALAVQWNLSKTEVSWLGSIGFVGMALGATFGGLLADKFGRRQIFALTLMIYGVATGASALVGTLAALMALRFFVGLGLGAELPVASTLISEFSPRAIRGRAVVLLEAFWAIGWILAAVIGTFVVAGSHNGWRWALALGCIPAAYSLVVRIGMPESVRFLESRGRHEEAETVVRSFEQSPKWLDVAPARRGKTTVQATSIWSSSVRRRTIALWAIWFCVNFAYYGAFIWIPSLLHAQGFTLVKSFTFTLIITLAQLPGYAVAAYLIERWGRRSTLATFLVGSAVAAGLYGFSTAEWQIITAGCLLSFFNLGAWGALYAIGPELYPTNIRGRGTGAAAGFGRIASIIAPLFVPPVLAAVGGLGLFTCFAVAFAIAALAALALPELKGESLS
ncbi:Putative niacin/nicotinamide transporter NaiP [Corynebacterium kalinowskii]|uniref:Niacin/nicotinamide transporter NaiP n=1 Tax=Corynebacterium kalinowskii TaxID=2675216 RepID=A0A6B8VA11_9CORY|nr:MFS transporter [Corynebacterium kalinowskii]QGU01183.1 Putative niacin/nicotinamide transporter NaiP [Corynebacterium kalinowskii]